MVGGTVHDTPGSAKLAAVLCEWVVWVVARANAPGGAQRKVGTVS